MREQTMIFVGKIHYVSYNNVSSRNLSPQSLVTNSPAPWPAASPASSYAREAKKLRHVTSLGKSKCISIQLVLVQQRNLRLQITIAK